MKKTVIFVIIGILLIISVGIAYKFLSKERDKQIETENLIHLFKPQPNDLITDKLIIEGEARGTWFFEAVAPFYILSSDFATMTSGYIEAKSDWMTENFVPFYKEVTFIPTDEKGFLLLKNDNPSGSSEKDLFYMLPLQFQIPETLSIKVFFNNSRLDPEFSCNKVFPVERKIIKTQAVAKAALEELLKGTTEEEKKEGFLTSINPDVKIQSLTIKNEIAYVDFNEQLEFQVGGSCRVAAIRSQIIETLKQFSTIKDVVISINGRTEDILQP